MIRPPICALHPHLLYRPLSPLQAFSGAHTAFLAISVVLVPCTVAYLLLMAATLVNRTPDAAGKKNVLCASHGRVFAASVLLKTALAAIWMLAGYDNAVLNGWIYTLLVLAVGLAHCALYVYALPYYHTWLNGLQAAVGFMVVGGCLCSLLSLGIGNSGASAGAIALLALLPLAAYGGVTSVMLRWAGFSHDSGRNASSPYLVDLRVRFLLQDALAMALASGRLGDSHLLSAADEDPFHQVLEMQGLLSAPPAPSPLQPQQGGFGPTRGASGGGNDDAATVSGGDAGMTGKRRGSALEDAMTVISKSGASRAGGASHVRALHAAAITLPKGLLGVAGEDCMHTRIVATDVSDKIATASRISRLLAHSGVGGSVAAMERLLLTALSAFASSALLEFCAAHFMGQIRNNKHRERQHLRAASEKADGIYSLDVQFFVWQRNAQLALAAERQASDRMTVEKRIQFEEQTDRAEELQSRARGLILQFWSVLQDRAPDLHRLTRCGAEVNLSIAQCNTAYEQLLAMAPQSATVMRRYGSFLLELANDPRRGQELLNDAEQVEEEQLRARMSEAGEMDVLLGAVVPEFDLSGEATSIVTVSAQPGSIGIMTSANAAALRALGFNSDREVVGKDVNVVVPDPISIMHPAMLEHYNQTGNEVRQRLAVRGGSVPWRVKRWPAFRRQPFSLPQAFVRWPPLGPSMPRHPLVEPSRPCPLSLFPALPLPNHPAGDRQHLPRVLHQPPQRVRVPRQGERAAARGGLGGGD